MGATPSRLLRSARRLSLLSQRDLARRARTSQSVIARIENGTASPSWKTLERLLSSAGFHLDVTLRPGSFRGSHMLADVARILRLTPEQRLLELRNAARLLTAARRVDGGRV